ncbi:MAG: acyl--CoA ligase [Lachnospiraceae bacterium]|nr:acyl--CoA ligase [Lachnospiraceae bacterium]
MKGFINERQAELDRLYPVWEKKTIWKFFEATTERFPDKEFVVAAGHGSYTYRQTKEEVLRIARGLVAAGVRPGDHVAMQIENCPEQAFVALAITAVRAVKVPVNTSLGAKELSFILRQSESQYLVTGCQIRLEDKENCLKQIIALPEARCEVDIPVLFWNEFLAAEEGQILPDSEGQQYADEVSDIIYTSGSTKAPKGVMLTHDMLMRSAFANCLNRGFELGRRIFVPLPMFHVYGYVEGMLAAILVGGAVLLRRGKFTAEPVLDFMQESRANDILSVPSQMMTLIHYLKEKPRKLPELHAVYCSAAICPSWVWPGIRDALEVQDVITGYGMTEVSGASMQTAPEDTDTVLGTRVGKLLPSGSSGYPELGGHQIAYRVVDQKTGVDCAPGEIGELWCRGAVVTRGYFNRVEANARVFTQDGWFRTGDCGCFDEAGYLILAGRVDDMYKINGENVSPKFLEDVLGNCPEINNVEIVGVPDEKRGYVGAAFIQLHEDIPENRERAENYSREHLAKFQVPKYFIYMKEADWPRTSTGKVQKFRLKEMAASYKAEVDR